HLPKSPMGEAIGYAQRQWRALTRYVEDGDLAIDNNEAERALRMVVVGRKNVIVR
ncbi:MAG: transposase, partial [Gemmatimonadota bacterium]